MTTLPPHNYILCPGLLSPSSPARAFLLLWLPSLVFITDSHLLFLLPGASCLRLAPAGLARPSEGAREARRGGVGLPQQLCSCWGDESAGSDHQVTVFLVPAGPRDRVFLEVWPGSPSHTMYLLSEVIINNECLGHDDHPWPTPGLGSYLWERIWRRPLAIWRTESINTQLIHGCKTSFLAPLDRTQ